MSIRAQFRVVKSLPSLTWLATFDAEAELTVFCGSDVALGDGFAVEGAWDGPFPEGGFDRTGNFFGSGVRVRQDEVWFVPSTSLTDRLIFLRSEDGQRWWVSNSVLAMLAMTGASLDRQWDYRAESFYINHGLDKFDREYRVSHPCIPNFEQLYFDSLVINSAGKPRLERKPGRVSIKRYEDYTGLVSEALDHIFRNARDGARAQSMNVYSTISSGYDSAAVTALAAPYGVDAAFTSVISSTPLPRWLSAHADDDGTPIARKLGVAVRYLDHRPENMSDDEVFYWAVNRADCEAVFDSVGREVKRSGKSALLLTGYHGGSMWGSRVPRRMLQEDMPRDGSSGRALGEARLSAGYVNVAVPFLYCREISALAKITSDEALRPYRLNNQYDKPVARRILEEAGVPRWMFGQAKSGLARRRVVPIGPRTRRRCLLWIQEHYGISPHKMDAIRWANAGIFRARRALVIARSRSRSSSLKIHTRQRAISPNIDSRDLVFRWAVAEGTARLAAATAQIVFDCPKMLMSP